MLLPAPTNSLSAVIDAASNLAAAIYPAVILEALRSAILALVTAKSLILASDTAKFAILASDTARFMILASAIDASARMPDSAVMVPTTILFAVKVFAATCCPVIEPNSMRFTFKYPAVIFAASRLAIFAFVTDASISCAAPIDASARMPESAVIVPATMFPAVSVFAAIIVPKIDPAFIFPASSHEAVILFADMLPSMDS